MKLKSLVSEDWYTDKKRMESEANVEPDLPQLSREDKIKFTEMVKRYNSYGGKIYNEHNLVEIAKDLSKIAEMAEAVTMSSVDESFDTITVQRNIKELKQLSSQFNKVATESQAAKLRMTSLYEDMGNILGRYFEITEDEDLKLKGDVSKTQTAAAAAAAANATGKEVNGIRPNDPDVKKFVSSAANVEKKINN